MDFVSSLFGGYIVGFELGFEGVILDTGVFFISIFIFVFF